MNVFFDAVKMRYLIMHKTCGWRSKHLVSKRTMCNVAMVRNITFNLKFSLKLTHPLKLFIKLARSLCHSCATCIY